MKPSDDSKEVTVYNYLTFEGKQWARVPAPFKATRERIDTVLRGKVLEGTAEKVLASRLDQEGRYQRRATGWGELTD